MRRRRAGIARLVAIKHKEDGMERREGNYADIIHLPHPSSKSHPQMSRQDRAAQFSPFAALTGYEEVIQETARRVEERMNQRV